MAKKTSDPSASTLSSREQKALAEKVGEFKAAQKQVTDAVAVMWSSQLEVAIQTGDRTLVDQAIRRPPVGLWDDCNCNQKSCGGGFLPDLELIDPLIRKG